MCYPVRMSDLRIEPISPASVRRVLLSNQLTDVQKTEFLKQHEHVIRHTLAPETITKSEFKMIMQNRPLIRFRPIKNSLTKQGDKILLAKTLGVEPKEVDNYINAIIKNDFAIIHSASEDDIEKVRTYVYRHGTKEQVVQYLGHELSDTKTVLEKLYQTLRNNSGGLADYFSRPIHAMSNKTMVQLYDAIDKSLRNAEGAGDITHEKCNSTAEWALVRIYEIQNNSKLIRAVDKYKELK